MDIAVENQYIAQYVAFDADRLVGAGSIVDVARAAKACVDAGLPGPLLLFDAVTSEVLELDLRGTVDDVLARLPAMPASADGTPAGAIASSAPDVKSGPGRPRLGVVAREITLLPRHWQWLSTQPGGASVTIRRLVEEARTVGAARDQRRRAQEAAYRFMSAMLGNQPGYEEATRALFAGDATRFAEYAAPWPKDLREHARRLAGAAFEG